MIVTTATGYGESEVRRNVARGITDRRARQRPRVAQDRSSEARSGFGWAAKSWGSNWQRDRVGGGGRSDQLGSTHARTRGYIKLVIWESREQNESVDSVKDRKRWDGSRDRWSVVPVSRSGQGNPEKGGTSPTARRHGRNYRVYGKDQSERRAAGGSCSCGWFVVVLLQAPYPILPM